MLRIDSKREEVLQQLLIFLKEHKALSIYRDNLIKCQSKHTRDLTRIAIYPLIYILTKDKVRFTENDELISKAFIWRETKQGFNYWNKIDEKWRKKILIKHTKKNS